jgi:RNase H-fold protein (predicted Holliday junction resolvase)
MRIVNIAQFRKALGGRYAGMNIAALDVGQKHIGLALTSPMTADVAPVGDISRKPPRNQAASIDKVNRALQRFVDQHNVGGVVIGFPLSPSGGITPFCEEIVHLVSNMQCTQPATGGDGSSSSSPAGAEAAAERPPLLATFWDERNSTVGARRLISQMSRRRSVVSKYKDSMAACLILDGFLKNNFE